ncbi:MAG: rRNA maturation RNase YbeY [Neisseriaceae bacterium]|nr:MAG: rRNA maturation RNase YbeY [Neisseriaceae bacterium]
MKKAKEYPFYTVRQKRLSLTVDNVSGFEIPSYERFFNWIFEAMSEECSYATIGLLLCGVSQARYYNRVYRDKDYATNILSFPLALHEESRLRGDLIICPEVVQREAHEQNKILRSHYAHLLVHGVLHLMGYEHVEDDEAEVMESKEISILHRMGYQNPYLEDK